MGAPLSLKKRTEESPSTAPGSVATPVEADETVGLGGEDPQPDMVDLDTGTVSEAPPAFKAQQPLIIAALEAAALSAQQSGQVGSQVLLYQIALAAGNLKQTTKAAIGKVGGEIGAMIEMLHNLL